MTSTLTDRSRAKAERRDALLTAAAALFAERGYSGASLEDIGAAVGVSGPAVYRHFSGKQAVLASVLLDASRGLLDGGTAVVGEAPDAASALRSLIRFHVDFALGNADVIRVQDRDMASLAAEDRHAVRSMQRRYVELWVGVLSRLRPNQAEPELRIRAHAAFGLLNSTPHSARLHLGDAQGRTPAETVVRGILEDMAWGSLTS